MTEINILDVPSILKRAADKAGFVRVRYIENDIPNNISNIAVVALFGDLRSSAIASSLLIKRFREENKGSKYLIVASWPGQEALYPYANEYWSIKDESILPKFFSEAEGLHNKSEFATLFPRELGYFFEDVTTSRFFDEYYHNGIQQGFFDKYKTIKTFLPAIPSSVLLGPEFNKELIRKAGYKIFISPVTHASVWKNNKLENVRVPKEFWVAFVEYLLKHSYCPVVLKNYFTHDISSDFVDKCVYVQEKDAGKIMAAMRATGCVLDLFSGISKLAVIARCPYVICEERNKYFQTKDYEIDDLCSAGVPREYIFSFPTIIESGDKVSWAANLFELLVARLNKFLPTLDRSTWPTSSETERVVPYEIVRKRVNKQLGIQFIKVPII